MSIFLHRNAAILKDSEEIVSVASVTLNGLKSTYSLCLVLRKTLLNKLEIQ